MSFFSQFAGGPAKVTQYTSGSGNYTPISTNQSWARVTVVGGGGGGSGGLSGGGNNAGGSGGGGAGTRIEYIKLNEASYAYAVGAGGAGGAINVDAAAGSGSKTTFGPIAAYGGGGARSAISVNNASVAGSAGFSNYTTNEASGNLTSYPGPGFLNGGVGGSAPAQKSGALGISLVTSYGTVTNNTLNNLYGSSATAGANARGGAPGGDSAYGIGGNGGAGTTNNNAGAGNAGNGYGAGGGGGGASSAATGGVGGAGSGGLIIIEEFVQA